MCESYFATIMIVRIEYACLRFIVSDVKISDKKFRTRNLGQRGELKPKTLIKYGIKNFGRSHFGHNSEISACPKIIPNFWFLIYFPLFFLQ